MLTQNMSPACASGIRDWRDHVRADQSQTLSNDQMADRRPLRRGEQFTLRIPAFARWRKSSINCVKLEKAASASPCFIPYKAQSLVRSPLWCFRQLPPESRLNFERSPSVAAGSVL